MVTRSFEATVSHGRLQHRESLASLEGRTVRVTVVAPEGDVVAWEEGEPPEGMDVERDVVVHMPRRRETLGHVPVVDRGRRCPTIVLPEGLPDE